MSLMEFTALQVGLVNQRRIGKAVTHLFCVCTGWEGLGTEAVMPQGNRHDVHGI